MNRFLLVRHGESIWNKHSRFTGWTDIPLTDKGRKEAKSIGNYLIRNNLIPDNIYTSRLDRAIETSNIINDTLKIDTQTNLEIIKDWRLNEKHYGSLEGVRRQYIRELYGEKYTKNMRQKYKMFPPILETLIENPFPVYRNSYLNDLNFIRGENKEMVYHRVLPIWLTIFRDIQFRQFPLIVTHKHTSRVLMKYLKTIKDDDFYLYELPEKSILEIHIDKNTGLFIKEIIHNFNDK